MAKQLNAEQKTICQVFMECIFDAFINYLRDSNLLI